MNNIDTSDDNFVRSDPFGIIHMSDVPYRYTRDANFYMEGLWNSPPCLILMNRTLRLPLDAKILSRERDGKEY